MRVPFGDLARQYEAIKSEIDQAAARVMRRGQFILGPEVREFERKFAVFCGAKFCVGTANGLEALQIALMALGIGPGDEVITTPLSAAATALAITAAGARPVFADIDPATFNIDPQKIEQAITPHTRAIIPVHLYGRPADMPAITNIAKKHKLIVVEDAAQAHGASFGKKQAGTFGVFGAFSFYPSKNLGAYGDGGALVCDNEKLAKLAYILRDYGQSRRYYHEYAGLNSRLDELQAAVLRGKLNHLPAWNRRRAEIASMYSMMLKDLPLALPKETRGVTSCHHLYVIRTNRRDQLQKYLATRNILTQIHYPLAVYQQPALKIFGFRKGLCKHAEKATKEILSLPIFPELRNNEVLYICKLIRKFFTYGH